MEAEAVLDQPMIPMELSTEEIEKNQNTQHFKAKVFQSDTTAILKIPNARENWDVYFNGQTQCFSLGVKIGNDVTSPVVKFRAELSYDYSDGPDEGFMFRFQPEGKIPRSVKQLTGKYRLEFLDNAGTPYRTFESTIVNMLPNTNFEHPHADIEKYFIDSFLTRSIVLEDAHLGQDDTITMKLTFTYCFSEVLEYPNEYRLKNIVSKTTDKILLADMEKLLYESNDHDFAIKTSDGVIKPAHKLILQNRVPMFHAMFNTDMIESSNNEVTTPEISSGAMTILLHYIYTGKLHEDWRKKWRSVVNEVLHGAKQYGLDGLIQHYDRLLITLCSDVDAGDLMEIAKLHGLKQAEKDISKWQMGIVME